MADRDVVYRYSSEGLPDIARLLEQIGSKAQEAAQKIHQGGHDSSAALEALNVVSERAQEKMHEMSGEAGLLGDMLLKLGPGGLVAGAAIGGLTALMVEATKAFDEHTVAHAKIQAVLTATSGAVGLTASRIQELAVEIAKTSTVGVSEAENMATELLAMGSVTGEQFEKTIKLAADLGAVFGSAESATLALGKAMVDPTTGADSLARAHLKLTEAEKDHIKALQDEGDLLGAKAALLAAVEAHVGGAGAGAKAGLAGAMHDLTVSTHEFFVELGNTPLVGKFADGLEVLAILVDHLSKSMGDDSKLKQLKAELADPDFVRAAGPRTVELIQQQIEALQKLVEQKQLNGEYDDLTAKHNKVLADDAAKKTDDDKKQLSDLQALADATTKGMEAWQKTDDLRQKDAQRRGDMIAGLTTEADARSRMADAVTQGGAAVDALNLQLEIEANLRKLGSDASPAEIQAVIDETTKIHYAADAVRDYNQAKADQAKAEDAAARAAEEASKRLQKQLDDEAKAVQKMAVDMGSHVVDALINMVEGAKKPFDALLQYAKHIFEQVVAAALLNPIIVPMIVNAIGGIGGGGAAGALASGGSIASLAGTSGLVSLGGLSLSGAIDAGGYALGVGGSASIGADGLASVTPYLSSYLGPAAIGGALGYGFGAITGGNKTISSIGGTAAGVALALGQPEIAAAIAAIAAIGSLIFKGHPSDKLEGDYLDIASGTQTPYGYTGDKFSSDNASQASQLGQSVIGFANILTAGGLHPNFASNARVEVGDRGSPYRVWYGDINGDQQSGQFQSAQEAFQAIAQQIVASLGTVPADVQKAIDNIDYSNLKAFTDQLNEIAAFHVTLAQVHQQLEQIKDPKQAELDALDAQFQPILDEANKLGEDTAEIEELWGLKKKQIVDKYASQITTTLDNTTQTVVTAVGDWTQIVGQYYDNQMSAIQAQYDAAANLHDAWANVRDSLASTQSGLLVDPNLSPLSLEQRDVEAKNQFDAAFTKAMGGDQNAAASLSELAKAFLTADMAFQHGNQQYADDFSQVMGKLAQAQSFAGAQVTIEQLQLDALTAILKTLQSQKGLLTGGASPNYNAADAKSLTGAYGQALAGSGQSEADFLHSSGGAVWIAARNQLIAGTTDPALLASDLATFKAQSAQPGLADVGQSGIDAVIAQFKTLGLPIPSYDVGGYIPKTGLAMVHAGERVLTASDNSNLAAEVAALRAAVVAIGERQLADNREIADNTGRAADAHYDAAVLAATSARTKVL